MYGSLEGAMNIAQMTVLDYLKYHLDAINIKETRYQARFYYIFNLGGGGLVQSCIKSSEAIFTKQY